MNTLKAPATSPPEAHCHGCGTVCPYTTVDVARAHQWKIGWRPDHPSWCPTCYPSNRSRPPSPEPYDEELPFPTDIP